MESLCKKMENYMGRQLGDEEQDLEEGRQLFRASHFQGQKLSESRALPTAQFPRYKIVRISLPYEDLLKKNKRSNFEDTPTMSLDEYSAKMQARAGSYRQAA